MAVGIVNAFITLVFNFINVYYVFHNCVHAHCNDFLLLPVQGHDKKWWSDIFPNLRGNSSFDNLSYCRSPSDVINFLNLFLHYIHSSDKCFDHWIKFSHSKLLMDFTIHSDGQFLPGWSVFKAWPMDHMWTLNTCMKWPLYVSIFFLVIWYLSRFLMASRSAGSHRCGFKVIRLCSCPAQRDLSVACKWLL